MQSQQYCNPTHVPIHYKQSKQPINPQHCMSFPCAHLTLARLVCSKPKDASSPPSNRFNSSIVASIVSASLLLPFELFELPPDDELLGSSSKLDCGTKHTSRWSGSYAANKCLLLMIPSTCRVGTFDPRLKCHTHPLSDPHVNSWQSRMQMRLMILECKLIQSPSSSAKSRLRRVNSLILRPRREGLTIL